jgi:hypothetical protein
MGIMLRYHISADGQIRVCNAKKGKCRLTVTTQKPPVKDKARQGHGFTNENTVIKRFGLRKEQSYTAKWDAYSPTDVPISIKSPEASRPIEFGSYWNQINVTEDFYIIYSPYAYVEKDGVQIRVFAEPVIAKIPATVWNGLFDTAFNSRIKRVMEQVTNDKSDDTKFKELVKDFKSQYIKSKAKMNVLFKRDHKTQKRVQCSLDNTEFLKLINKYKQKEII